MASDNIHKTLFQDDKAVISCQGITQLDQSVVIIRPTVHDIGLDGFFSFGFRIIVKLILHPKVGMGHADPGSLVPAFLHTVPVTFEHMSGNIHDADPTADIVEQSDNIGFIRIQRRYLFGDIPRGDPGIDRVLNPWPRIQFPGQFQFFQCFFRCR